MKYLKLDPFCNECIFVKTRTNKGNFGINGYWFVESKGALGKRRFDKNNSIYLDGQKLNLNIDRRVKTLYFYCFSENQTQNLNFVINDNEKYFTKVIDWGDCNSYDLKYHHVKIYRKLLTNKKRVLNIYISKVNLFSRIELKNIHFEFNPCIHIIAIGYK